MTSIQQLNWKIYLKPEHFSFDIHSNLLEGVKKELSNKCSNEYGYILEVRGIVKIIDNKLINNSKCMFELVVEVITLKPEVGAVFSGEIFMVFDKGIFVKIQNKLKILVPLSYLVDYKYNKEDNSYINTKRVLHVNDAVDVKILGIQYSKKEFNCFGEFA